jgi:hypothetical protein
VVSFTTQSLNPQEKSPWYSLDRRLDGHQSRSERGGEEKNSQPPPGFEAPDTKKPEFIIENIILLIRLH